MPWLPAILILPYFFLLLKIYRDLLKITPFHALPFPRVNISVIIPCRDDNESLPALLKSLSVQDYPPDMFEVIIVDDNQEGRKIESVQVNTAPLKLSVIDNNAGGKKEAIRKGVMASSGRLIVTTDADCTAGKSWLRTIASLYAADNPDMIVSPVCLEPVAGFLGKFQELEYLGLQGLTAGTVAAGNGIMCNGANLAFTRDAYIKNADNLRFDLASGDDVFLLHSIKREENSKIMWLESTDAAVTTAAERSLWSFYRQRIRWVSKWRGYTDGYTIITALLTLSATLLQASMFVALFFDMSLVWPFSAILVLKSVPDFLILRNTAERYGKRGLLRWFLPSQMIYPFYVLAVSLGSLVIPGGKRS